MRAKGTSANNWDWDWARREMDMSSAEEVEAEEEEEEGGEVVMALWIEGGSSTTVTGGGEGGSEVAEKRFCSVGEDHIGLLSQSGTRFLAIIGLQFSRVSLFWYDSLASEIQFVEKGSRE